MTYKGYEIKKVDNSAFSEEMGMRKSDLRYWSVEILTDGSIDEGCSTLRQAKMLVDTFIGERK